MPRPLVVIAALVLALWPTLSSAAGARLGGPCIFGVFLGAFETSPETVMVWYDFEFEAGEFLPDFDYADNLVVYVRQGEFTLEVLENPDQETEQRAVVRRGWAETAEGDEQVVGPNESVELLPGDIVQHERATYWYRFTNPESNETQYLTVAVTVPRQTYLDALQGGTSERGLPALDHQQICLWCLLDLASTPEAETASSPISPAKRIPGITCRGG
jgi:hypothetical protein